MLAVVFISFGAFHDSRPLVAVSSGCGLHTGLRHRGNALDIA
jgi:hypothetical protein